ncbi:MAG: OmpH family outer membrane protein [Prevotella sp.]|nr:OmpH family outer membrane protein [Prevotella sp.]
MKRLAIIIIALCAVLSVSAQDSISGLRFGYLSYEQALQAIPDYATAQKRLDDLQSQYEAELKRVEDEFNRKYEDFLDGQSEFPKTILRKRQTELQELMTKNIAFKEESRQQLSASREEMMAPLKERLSEVITQIATERGYAFVINTDADACPFINPAIGDDINQLVQDALK